ncbi:C40 family peptidase [Paraburkholderia sp. J41]|uniref:C40 family peptidase n=1 Tax=Paraburkholderia sp. J41 TaxID=2805433 RepID=UPI002AC316F8|nr:C40 family peptidase [Paraburkholderia sp. J41]
MLETTMNEIRAHAQRDYPREACGLVIVERGKEVYVPCRNVAETASEHFVLPGDDYAAAEDRGEVLAIVHSHPDASPAPSDGDRVSCEQSGLPWHIVSWPGGAIRTIEPSGFVAPLVGRAYAHGVLDCWSLVRDWYARERNIALPDFQRRDRWWDDGTSDLYAEHCAAAGGKIVWRSGDDVSAAAVLEVGDVILMQIRSKNGVPNHAAVYIGNTHILHHPYGRLSSRDIYGGYWYECTSRIVRYAR